MYESRFPEVDDLVMVNVRQIAEMGAYVHLMEYNNIEGMILLSELSRRRIRSIQKIIRVGKNEVAVVMRVDKEKGYIDLSKRRVSNEDVKKCEEKYNKSKSVHSIMRHVAERLGLNLEDLYTTVGWPLYKKYGHAYDGFKLAVYEPDVVFQGIDVSEDIRSELVANIRRRMTPQAVKIRADIEVTCYGYEGIDAIKAALSAGELLSTAEVPIKITLVAPPLYVMQTNAMDKAIGIAQMEKAIARIDEVIRGHSGNLNIKMKPRAVSETDDLELEKMIDEADRMNRDVDGDDDVSGSEDEDGEEGNGATGAAGAGDEGADSD
ncbi:eukaryotic translation initiation factor 2 alpha subunit-domain-containing protein [Zopfochytrium polystomum]|nr:eukaryotic translation initiation factor 2 alpha subunit-domain-containing protein [Zopfochytrium polystomum]